MNNKLILKNLTKDEIQDKQIAVMNKDLLFLWDKSKASEKKTKEIEWKTTRIDDGCKDMWETIQADRKIIKALEQDVKWIKFQEQVNHDREIELRQEKARKKAKIVSGIETVLVMIILVFALIGAVALSSGFQGV